MAHELDLLLQAAHLPGPYVVVTHSYGGIIAREFLARRLQDVVGMVFGDAEQEGSATVMDVPWEILFRLLGDLDYFGTVGQDEEHQLRPEEWSHVKIDSEQTQSINDAENVESVSSCDRLCQKQQVQNQVHASHPVAVLKGNSTRDYQRIYDAIVATGRGTDRELQVIRDLVDRLRTKKEPLQRAILGLSRLSQFVFIGKTGHNVQLTRPSAIAEQLKWVLDHVVSATRWFKLIG